METYNSDKLWGNITASLIAPGTNGKMQLAAPPDALDSKQMATKSIHLPLCCISYKLTSQPSLPLAKGGNVAKW